jgi:muconate cycloisomerase
MKIVRCEIWEVDLPFKLTFKHSLHERSTSGSVILRLQSDTGDVGWGESLPREYVTGETTATVVERLTETFLPVLMEHRPASWEEALEVAEKLEIEARQKTPDLPDRIGATRCAAELAFLDLAGKHFRRSVAEIFGKRKREWVEYSGVISSDAPYKVAKTSLKMRAGGIRFVKIKVGGSDDVQKVKRIRCLMGAHTDLRVDANAAWDASTAISRIQALKPYGITSVEQPIPAEDIEGLQTVTSAVTTPIMVDESLCSLTDARRLVAQDACDYFNIRLSKCGGLIASLELAEFARNHDKGCQLGCQVGETAILSAAGRHFALGVAGLKYIEGSFGTHLLEQDVAKQNLTFGRKGIGRPLNGPGLGIQVLPERIEPFIRTRSVVGEGE